MCPSGTEMKKRLLLTGLSKSAWQIKRFQHLFGENFAKNHSSKLRCQIVQIVIQYRQVPTSNALKWPSTTKYQPVFFFQTSSLGLSWFVILGWAQLYVIVVFKNYWQISRLQAGAQPRRCSRLCRCRLLCVSYTKVDISCGVLSLVVVESFPYCLISFFLAAFLFGFAIKAIQCRQFSK